ncbi:uridine kinase [Tumebacillus sp. BK434]|uniref:kinase n=1 Tax=Tumebacillus sp. BK434 TaxID=2512169 RepID=UPI0010498DE4|nr:kinase [Tumebacillus sp. BK434]TCP55985.1 uridine kinase [Tumebacillus sp. BK434]
MTFIDEILSKKHPDLRLLLGIDGLSGAGKTTLVQGLAAELERRGIETAVLHVDDLITVRERRYHTGQPEWYEHYTLQWDAESIAENVFRAWVRGDRQLELDVYDSAGDAVHPQTFTVPQDGILIVEGVYLQRKEWRGFFDYMVYIDCPREVRFARVTKRGGQDLHDPARIDLYKRRYWAAEDHYLQTEQPLARADFIRELSE